MLFLAKVGNTGPDVDGGALLLSFLVVAVFVYGLATLLHGIVRLVKHLANRSGKIARDRLRADTERLNAEARQVRVDLERQAHAAITTERTAL